LFLVCFEPAPAPPPRRGRRSEPADDHTRKELEDELAATREHLQTLVEELETSNEEMQALNEEVQASNEELEASNEELQSTNEELTTLNEELQVKTSELEGANAELQNIQNSLDFPLMAVDHHLHLTRFNQPAARLFRLNATAIGASVREITWPTDVPDFSQTIGEVLRCRRKGRPPIEDSSAGDTRCKPRTTPLRSSSSPALPATWEGRLPGPSRTKGYAWHWLTWTPGPLRAPARDSPPAAIPPPSQPTSWTPRQWRTWPPR
jgi:two-component system CheB/CheR fusion protein